MRHLTDRQLISDVLAGFTVAVSGDLVTAQVDLGAAGFG
jgi:hypothetical protein